MKFKFVVEQGEKKADDVEYGVIQVRDRLYRHPRGKFPPIEARHLWFSTFRPSGWESFPIWPGTETDEIEVRARLGISENGALELCLNDSHVAWLVGANGEAMSNIPNAIRLTLQEIREGKP